MNCASVEARCDASEVFELVEATLDGIADLVGFEVVRDEVLSGGIAGDYRLRTDVGDQRAQGV